MTGNIFELKYSTTLNRMFGPDKKTDGFSADSVTIDTKGFEGALLTFSVLTEVVVGTITFEFIHSDEELTGFVPMDSDDLLGEESLNFDLSVDNQASKTVAYIGKKRYIKYVATGVYTGDVSVCGECLLSQAHHQPTE